MALNATFASPTADAKFAAIAQQNVNGILSTIANGTNAWTIAATLFLALVVYDQRECFRRDPRFRELANSSTVKYISNKGSIAGPALKMPFIGPFLESVNPQFTKYHEKWMSGDLSCVSVFHKYVCITCSLVEAHI